MRTTRLGTSAACLAALLGFAAAPAAHAAVPSERGWRADVRHAMHGSLAYLDRRTAAGGGRPAVNLDIDNTALATYYEPGRPVRPVLRFVRHAERLGVAVLFNTGRARGDGRLRAARRELRHAGFPVDGLCGRRQGERLAHGKQRCRRHYARAGYTLIANVGNRPTDFAGRGYERAFRLPSYHYRLG